MSNLTRDYLSSILSYNPDTGIFTWRIKRNCFRGCVHPGQVAGTTRKGRRYITIRIDGHPYFAHRLAWFYMTGEWPEEIDHANRNPSDNRWKNLRIATRTQNNGNRTASRPRLKGVQRARNKWASRIGYNGVRHNLGHFDTTEEAHAAYRQAAERYFGEFANSD